MIKRYCDKCKKEMKNTYQHGESNLKLQVLDKSDWRACRYTFCKKCTNKILKYIEKDDAERMGKWQ